MNREGSKLAQTAPLADGFPCINTDMRYVVVCGGVCSSLGKGVTSSSIGALLRGAGYRVCAIKIDPYLNPDAGLMSPFEHGEVFVLDDGGEADLDLGNYERFMGLSLMWHSNITAGKVYCRILENERKGKYLGKTVQVVPHVTNEIVQWIDRVANTPVDGSQSQPQVCIIELGGTVGDIESMIFVEALRMLRFLYTRASLSHHVAIVQVSLVPIMSGQKTKPTQHTVRKLMEAGLTPDVLVCRCAEPLQDTTRSKIAFQCNIMAKHVLSCHNVPNLYSVPGILYEQGIVTILENKLHLSSICPTTNLVLAPGQDPPLTREDFARLSALPTFTSEPTWRDPEATSEVTVRTIRIAIVGKYTGEGADTSDAYLSVEKALLHATMHFKARMKLVWVSAEDMDSPGLPAYKEAMAQLQSCDGVLVPGGFGTRGTEGKITAINYARVNSVPYLGICLGMQMAVVELARNVLKWEGATTAEIAGIDEVDPKEEDGAPPSKKSKGQNGGESKNTSARYMTVYMPEIDRTSMGANMRLGRRDTFISEEGKESMCRYLYGGAYSFSERHRHRYEINPKHVGALKKAGVLFPADADEGRRRIVLELPRIDSAGNVNIATDMPPHPFFFAVQYHPEFKSRPMAPSPPFVGFIAAMLGPKVLDQALQDQLTAGPINRYRPDDVTHLHTASPLHAANRNIVEGVPEMPRAFPSTRADPPPTPHTNKSRTVS